MIDILHTYQLTDRRGRRGGGGSFYDGYKPDVERRHLRRRDHPGKREERKTKNEKRKFKSFTTTSAPAAATPPPTLFPPFPLSSSPFPARMDFTFCKKKKK